MSLLGFLGIEKAEKHSHEILLDYLRERSQLFDLRNKFVDTRQKIFYIVQTMTNAKMLDKCRVRFL